MKIILKAFQNKLWGKPIEVPDNIGNQFVLPMPMDILAYKTQNNASVPVDAVMKKATFTRTGLWHSFSDFEMKPNQGERDRIAEYILTSIS